MKFSEKLQNHKTFKGLVCHPTKQQFGPGTRKPLNLQYLKMLLLSNDEARYEEYKKSFPDVFNF
jgi:hypothetical protein